MVAIKAKLGALKTPTSATVMKRKKKGKARSSKRAKVDRTTKEDWSDGMDIRAFIRDRLTKHSACEKLNSEQEDLLVDLIHGMMPRSEEQIKKICRSLPRGLEGCDFASVGDVREILSSKQDNNYHRTVVVHIDSMCPPSDGA